MLSAKDSNGRLWLEITDLDRQQPVEIEMSQKGFAAKSAGGKALTTPRVDSGNTFDLPNTVLPKPISVEIRGAN